MKIRFYAFILTIIMVMTMINTDTKAADVKTTLISANYEGSDITSGYVNNIKDSKASYISGNSNIEVFREKALSGYRSLKIKNCDMRWWSLSLEEPEIYYNFKIRIDDNFDNPLHFEIYTQHLQNPDAKDTILSVVPDGSNAVLKDQKGNKVFTFEKDKVHKISVRITRGESIYTLYVDNNEVSRSDFFIPIYKITGMRLYVTNSSPDSYICFDDFQLHTGGTNYPQMYSYQKPGELPEINLPEIEREKYISLFINTVKINLDKIPLEKNNTLYLPLERVMECAGLDVEISKGNITIRNDKVTAVVKDNTLTVNNTEVKINKPVIKHKGAYMASLQLFNEVLNCKIWWDEVEKTVVFTTGKYKSDDILRVINGKLYMNGEPYYEISFNKFDLCYQIAADYYHDNSYPTEEFTYAAAEKALKQLSDLGFKSIRVFCTNSLKSDIMYSEEDRAAYFEIMDKMYDLCDKYDIKVVACLGLPDTMFVKKKFVEKVGWVSDGESMYDLITDKNSASRQNLYSFLDEYIGRYKDRKTILMWEIVNEGNLDADIGATVSNVTYSLLQLSEFYTDVTERIHSIDSDRLVTGGDSISRPAQWNLFKGVMEGAETSNWTVDTPEERLMALYLINNGVDVISTHTYNIGAEYGYDTYYRDKNGERIVFGFEYLMEEARKLGKILYNGETAGSVGATEGMDTSDPAYMEGRIKYLELIVDAGVQLSHWWTFRSDRQGFNDGDTWRNDKGPFLEAIVKANEELQKRYKVNKAASANTNTVWQDLSFSVIDENIVKPGKYVKLKDDNSSLLIGLGVIALITLSAVSVFALHKKRSRCSK